MPEPKPIIIIGYEHNDGYQHEACGIVGTYEGTNCERLFKDWTRYIQHEGTQKSSRIKRTWKLTGTFRQDESEYHEG